MFKLFARLLLVLLPPILISIMTYRFLWTAFMVPVNSNNNDVVLFEIAPGASFRSICKNLSARGLSRYWMTIEVLSRMGSKDKLIKAGEYELKPSMTPKQLLAKLLSGEVYRRTVLVKEGNTIYEVANAIETAGLMRSQEFILAVTDATLLATAGISSSSFEGYLFPNTYYFSKPVTAKEIIWTMLEDGEKRWIKDYSDQADKLMLSRHEILTLASIIEKESGNVDEQPIISSVFHNRLANSMKLQSDPTVIYGIKDFNGNLTREDLQDVNNPYNTYVNLGLPPGPIGNPGETAIKAALYPTQSTYLFFVADGQGRHVFSTTLQEHTEAVNRYQRNKGAAASTEPNALPPTNANGGNAPAVAPSAGH